MDTKQIIVQTSALYLKYGIKSISVDDIAFMLGISKKTLYENIICKENLIQKVVDYNLHSTHEKIKRKIAYPNDVFLTLCSFYAHAIKEVNKINPSYIYDLKKHHCEQYNTIVAFRDEELYKTIATYYKQGIEDGIFRDDINLRFIYSNQIHKLSLLVYDSVVENTLAISVKELYKLIINDIRGITTVKGHKLLNQKYEELLKLM